MGANGAIIFLGDGMADEPIESLGGRTPLQAANTPGMDAIARDGVSGTLLTLPEGFPTSSDVANMSVLGCDLPSEYCGRGPLEALGRGVPLQPGQIVFRMNLVSVADGVLTDFSGGHPAQADADALIGVLNAECGAPGVRFHSGVSYRCLLTLDGEAFSSDVVTEKPDDHTGDPVVEYLPRAASAEADATAALLRRLMTETRELLENTDVNRRLRAEGKPMINGVWPGGGGRLGAFATLGEKYGISGAVISAVDVIMGLGRALGMDPIHVPGATGYIDTNFEGKADAAVDALRTHDLVYLHVEAIDEVSHAGNLGLKIEAIEMFDRRVVRRVMSAVGPDVTLAVLPDHPVPVALGKHTRTPVPVSVRSPDRTPDEIRFFDEVACPRGALGALRGDGLMRALFPPRRLP